MENSILTQIKSGIKNWWVFLLLGLLYIAGGIFMATYPVASYAAISVVLAIWVLSSGILYIAFAVTNTKLPGWGWYLASGILELLLGIFLCSAPELVAASIPYFIAFWLMFRGISIISSAINLSEWKIPNWGWVLVMGICMLLLSFCALYSPLSAGMGLIVFIAAAFIAGGIGLVLFSFKIKNLKKNIISAAQKIEQDINTIQEQMNR